MKKYDIFISYRRNGGWETAKHLYDLMTRDGYSVSFDIDTLREGLFDEQMLRRIDECTDFIVILDEHVFDRTIDNSIARENDWLRIELAYAIEYDKNIIPIMLRGFNAFPDNLPGDIIKVKRYNAPKYDDYYFNNFYDLLLNKFIHSTPRSINYIIKKITFNKIINRIALPIFILFAFIILVSKCADDVSTYEIDEIENVSDNEMFNEGKKYYYGEGVAVDYKKAVYWYQKAAEKGNDSAMYNLAICYEEVYDSNRAVYWYQRAAYKGNADAMFKLAICYQEGKVVEQDYNHAVYWYEKAADKGNADAMNNLGIYYTNGIGVQHNDQQAVYWYRKGAEKGNTAAMINLGNCYENGNGVDENLSIANKLYKASDVAEAGDEDCAIEMVNDALK